MKTLLKAIESALVIILLSLNFLAQDSSVYKIGEKLTYNISFENIKNAGYLEFWVASRGKFRNEDAVELRSTVRTTNLLSAMYLIDRSQVCIASVKTGMPLYNKIIFNEEATLRESIQETTPAYHNFLTTIYQLRFGGNNIVFQEGDKTYTLSWQTVAKEKIKTDLGEFETSVLELQSAFFDEFDISSVRVNLTEDERRLPVLVKLKLKKRNVTVSIASYQIRIVEIEDETPQPTPQPTPQATPQPTPKATPTPYVENQPLSDDLPFTLGESLTYEVVSANRKIGTVVLQAKERRLFKGKDALLLRAEVIQASSPLTSGDVFISWIDPTVLIPFNFETKLSGNFANYNQSLQFDQETGFVNLSNGNRSEIPIGTHSLLSLAYALRTFKLEYQKNKQTDVRVAVFFGNKYRILTFRPISQETIDFNDKKLDAVVVSISANDPSIDKFGMRVWISNDAMRLPLRFMFGQVQANLKSVSRSSQ